MCICVHWGALKLLQTSASDDALACKRPNALVGAVLAWLERCLGPHLREFKGIFTKLYYPHVASGPAEQQAARDQKEGKQRLFILSASLHAQKTLNEICDFQCIIHTTTRIPLLIKLVCLTILSRSMRNQYRSPKEPQPL